MITLSTGTKVALTILALLGIGGGVAYHYNHTHGFASGSSAPMCKVR